MDFSNAGDGSVILFVLEFLAKYKEKMLRWIGAL